MQAAAAKLGRVECVPISVLKQQFFVREKLNEKHAETLALLMIDGVEMPPIKVTNDLTVVDGRHRIRAAELIERESIIVEFVEFSSKSDMIAFALKQNSGGALPPTADDIRAVCAQLIEQGETETRIKTLLSFIPASAVRKMIVDARGMIGKRKMRVAIHAVSHGGLRVPEAAEKFGVDEEALRCEITGERRRKSAALTNAKGILTQQYRSTSAKNGKLLQQVLNQVEDGEMKQSVADGIFAHLESLVKQQAKAIADWKARYVARVKGGTN